MEKQWNTVTVEDRLNKKGKCGIKWDWKRKSASAESAKAYIKPERAKN